MFLADFSPISQQNRLYCFEEGAEQFLLDVAQNTNDIEEFIWCNLCKAQVGRDRRPFMRGAYNMFEDGGDPEKVY
ncbi:Tetratricopeptide repeat (TPR) superfamily protein [Trifolium repens]|nr:Tetratricopeptide repeat (TPR) superfamily protein [Trifolium repens]